jgi:glycerol-3-phosphate dehydrogenase
VGLVKEDGRLTGVDVVDNALPLAVQAEQPVVRLRARAVVNATGVWMQKVSELSGSKAKTQVVPAKGVHVTLKQSRLPIQSAMIAPSVHDERFCFIIPWYDSVVIGTTDTEYHGDLEKLEITPEEISYLLDAANALFPGAQLSTADITGSFAGLRPLIKDMGKTSTADLSRQHRLEVSDEGLISIAGGKLTTYRRMAQSTVDVVVKSLPTVERSTTIQPCKTAELYLGGWVYGDDVPGICLVYRQMAHTLGLDKDTQDYLPTVYGKRVRDILVLMARDPRQLGRKLGLGHPYIAAQVVYAVRQEGALTLEDVLARRIRLAITDRNAALSAAEDVAGIMMQELGWSSTETAAQLERFRKDWG